MLLVFALFYTTDQAKSLTLGSLLDFHKNLTMEKETWSAKIDMVKRKDFTKNNPEDQALAYGIGWRQAHTSNQ